MPRSGRPQPRLHGSPFARQRACLPRKPATADAPIPEPKQTPASPAGKEGTLVPWPARHRGEAGSGAQTMPIRPRACLRRLHPSRVARPREPRRPEKEHPRGPVMCFPRTGCRWESRRWCSAWRCRRRRTSSSIATSTVKIIVRNSGSTDAQGVMVRDELPAGLTFVSASPRPSESAIRYLSWRISTLPAGSERDHLAESQAEQDRRSPRPRGDRDLPDRKQGHQPGAPAPAQARSRTDPDRRQGAQEQDGRVPDRRHQLRRRPGAERDRQGQAQPWLAPRYRRAQ